jgi:hypothetical protein
MHIDIYIPPDWINATNPKTWREVAEGAGDFEDAFKAVAKRLPKLYKLIDTLLAKDDQMKFSGRKTAAQFGCWTDTKCIIKLTTAQWKAAKEFWDVLEDRPAPIAYILDGYRPSMPTATPTRISINKDKDTAYACFEGSYEVGCDQVKFAQYADLAYVIALQHAAVFGTWQIQAKQEGSILYRVLDGKAVGAVMCITGPHCGGIGMINILTEKERESQERNRSQVETACTAVP